MWFPVLNLFSSEEEKKPKQNALIPFGSQNINQHYHMPQRGMMFEEIHQERHIEANRIIERTVTRRQTMWGQ